MKHGVPIEAGAYYVEVTTANVAEMTPLPGGVQDKAKRKQ